MKKDNVCSKNKIQTEIFIESHFEFLVSRQSDFVAVRQTLKRVWKQKKDFRAWPPLGSNYQYNNKVKPSQLQK